MAVAKRVPGRYIQKSGMLQAQTFFFFFASEGETDNGLEVAWGAKRMSASSLDTKEYVVRNKITPLRELRGTHRLQGEVLLSGNTQS